MTRRLIGSLAALASVLAAACDGINISGPGRGTVRQACPLFYDSNWPTNQGRITTNSSFLCPLRAFGPSLSRYVGTAELRIGRFARYIDLRFVDNAGSPHEFYLQSPYRMATGVGSDTLDVYQFNNLFTLANTLSGMSDRGADTAYHSVPMYGSPTFGDPVTATLVISYEYGASLSVSGPVEVLPSQSWTLQGTSHDPNLVEPLSYEWRRNGVAVGSGPNLNVYSTQPGEQNEFTFIVTDAQGTTVSQTHSVRTKTCDSAGCNDV